METLIIRTSGQVFLYMYTWPGQKEPGELSSVDQVL